MQIVVATPTGHVGQHVVRALIRAGVRPRVLIRDASRIDPAIAEHVEVRIADLYDADAVVSACAGADALYWVTPPGRTRSPLQDYEQAARSPTRAVEEADIGRVVLQSSVGAEKRHGVGDIDGLAATEIALEATQADVTHLRCGYFFTNLELQIDALREGTIPVIVPPEMPMAWVAPRDIAEVAAGLLLSTSWHGRQVRAVHGPADLTWDEVASTLSETLGTPIRVERIEDEQMAAGLRGVGMSEDEVEAILGMSTGMREDFTPEQPRSAVSTTPTTLGGWAYEQLRPLFGRDGARSHRARSSAG